MNALFSKDNYNAHEFRLCDFLYFFNDFSFVWGFLAPWRMKLNYDFIDILQDGLKNEMCI
jgi:hypothetical protein